MIANRGRTTRARRLRGQTSPRIGRPNVEGILPLFQRQAGLSRTLLAGALTILVLSPVYAQNARVTVPEENFRLDPQGTVLATVLEGTTVAIVGSQGSWRTVRLDGWIWGASVRETDRNGFDLEVSKPNGENLREAASPDARRAAILKRGMLLEIVERAGNWVHVRRTAWMWGPSLSQTTRTVEAPPPEPEVSTPATPAASTATDPEESGADRLIVGDAPLRVLSSPDGDTIAVATPGTDVEVVAREGSWARVRLDGWVWIPSTLPLDSAALGESPSAADLIANPDRFSGRRVRWTVKYYSLERAEPVRTDFYEGEPFMLAAAPDPAEGMVYIAIPPELVSEIERLRPLQTVEVLARVRTGRSSVMGRPVLDLISVIRS